MLLDYKTLHFDVDPFHYFLVRVLVCSDFFPPDFCFKPFLFYVARSLVCSRGKSAVLRGKSALSACISTCVCLSVRVCVCARAHAQTCVCMRGTCACVCLCVCVSRALALCINCNAQTPINVVKFALFCFLLVW